MALCRAGAEREAAVALGRDVAEQRAGEHQPAIRDDRAAGVGDSVGVNGEHRLADQLDRAGAGDRQLVELRHDIILAEVEHEPAVRRYRGGEDRRRPPLALAEIDLVDPQRGAFADRDIVELADITGRGPVAGRDPKTPEARRGADRLRFGDLEHLAVRAEASDPATRISTAERRGGTAGSSTVSIWRCT